MATNFIIGCVTVIAIFFAVHVLARLLYASVGFFADMECRRSWYSCPYDVPWFTLDLKWDWFVTYTSSQAAWAISHLAAGLLVAVLSVVFGWLWTLLFKPLPESQELVTVEESTSDQSDTDEDWIYCTNAECRCDNHHQPIADTFIDGKWDYVPRCNSRDCPCDEHQNSDYDNMHAPLQEATSETTQVAQESALYWNVGDGFPANRP